jgi:hypothetical protein
MLLIAGPKEDPSLARLSVDAWHSWVSAVSHCATMHSDIVPLTELGAADETVTEWERAGLATRVPIGNLRLLRRGTLWEIDRP